MNVALYGRQVRSTHRRWYPVVSYLRFLSGDSVSKPVNESWIEKDFIPVKVRPYLHLARMDKQVGTMLLLWPCIWSTALAAPLGTFPDPMLLAKFTVGAMVMRGAGCTINDLWDRDFDKHVERTKSRPLARGDVTVPQAIAFLGGQLTCGLGVLLSLNPESILLALASMPLVVIYPLMKRFTDWPQLVLGLTFNWGALVGWTAAAGSQTSILGAALAHQNQTPHSSIMALPEQLLTTAASAVSSLPPGLMEQALPLYGAGVCWTLIYDTLYGYQDRSDDKKIGMFFRLLFIFRTPMCCLI